MMDQQRGKFIVVNDADLDMSASVPSSPAREKSTKALPTLAEGEGVNFDGIVAVVVKIKANGKLFLSTAPAGVWKFRVGAAADIKGVKFRVVRVNERGQIGLRMMNAIEVAAWELNPKPFAAVVVVEPTAPEPKVECTLTNLSLSKKGFSVSTDAQIKRQEQKERRLQGLAEKREKNRAINEREREVSKNAAVPGLSNKKLSQQFGADLAAKRKRARKLEPMLAAQEEARKKAESEKRSRTPAAVISLVVTGAK